MNRRPSDSCRKISIRRACPVRRPVVVRSTTWLCRSAAAIDGSMAPPDATLRLAGGARQGCRVRRVMTRGRRRWLVATVILVILGLLGAGVAGAVSDELGISSSPSDIPAEHPATAPAAPVAPPPDLTRITAPSSARLDLAVGELRDAVAD